MDEELSDEQLAAWEAFVFAHSTAMSQIERVMFEANTISLTWYDVLVALSNAPDRRLRMGALAESLVLSRSGLTRLIDRIERAGLVRREPSATDARGAMAVLTPQGEQAVEDAWPHYAGGIREFFLRNLTPGELNSLATSLGKVRDQVMRDK